VLGASSDVIRLLNSRPDIDAEWTEGKFVVAENAYGKIHLEDVNFRDPTRPGINM
jgi:ATP-binding cassette, subfamily B (MDR/TAP), member 1